MSPRSARVKSRFFTFLAMMKPSLNLHVYSANKTKYFRIWGIIQRRHTGCLDELVVHSVEANSQICIPLKAVLRRTLISSFPLSNSKSALRRCQTQTQCCRHKDWFCAWTRSMNVGSSRHKQFAYFTKLLRFSIEMKNSSEDDITIHIPGLWRSDTRQSAITTAESFVHCTLFWRLADRWLGARKRTKYANSVDQEQVEDGFSYGSRKLVRRELAESPPGHHQECQHSRNKNLTKATRRRLRTPSVFLTCHSVSIMIRMNHNKNARLDSGDATEKHQEELRLSKAYSCLQ
jgi:hypothetical protein